VDAGRLGTGETIAAAAGLALFIIMFIFKWFGVDFGSDSLGLGSAVDASANAWNSMEWIRWILLITALVAIGGALMTANAQSVNTPVAISAITCGLGILSVILILFRIIDPPSSGDIPDGFDISISRKIGVFLGLIAAGGIAYGGWRAMEEEGTSFQHQAEQVQRGGGEPPPPPPPAG
jgi:magnesium-transporting ATPase (P-type)